jgi:hypothetical protein
MIMDYKDSDKIINFLLYKPISYNTQMEKDYLLKTFCEKDNNVCTLDDLSFNNKENVFVKHERPDLIYIGNNNIVGIEHFEVDSSENNKKGSKYRRKYTGKYFDKQRKETFENLETGNVVVRTEKIETQLSYSSLLLNTEKVFDDHYKNIEMYTEEIKKVGYTENKKIEYLFLIEYSTIFPSFFQNEDEELIYFFPHNDIRFIN